MSRLPVPKSSRPKSGEACTNVTCMAEVAGPSGALQMECTAPGCTDASVYGTAPTSVVSTVKATASSSVSVYSKRSLSRVKGKGKGKGKGKVVVPGAQVEKKDDAPAFSVKLNIKKVVEREKKKIIRRNKPEGEDTAKLNEICKSMRGKKITAAEFIALVAPSCGDQGSFLKVVYDDELTNFRNTARKIYATMTQDVSDVLTNEHIQIQESTKERSMIYNEKIQRNINEIYLLVPDFDIDQFYSVEGYLDSKFPIPSELDENSEEGIALLRQEAYHRYQWLKSEGERLKLENTRLQKRMHDLKKTQVREMKMMAQREVQAEVQREELQERSVEMEQRYDQLNTSLERSLIETEATTIGIVERREQINPPPPTKNVRKEHIKKESWAEKMAVQIEAETISREAKAKLARTKSKHSKMQIKKVQKQQMQDQIEQLSPQRRAPRDTSPFHFSPLKSPQRQQGPRETSPFHFSPPKQQQEFNPQAASTTVNVEAEERVRTETSTTVVEGAAALRSPRGRQVRGPKDTWKGFE